jgi:signal transduction histidine kinase
VRDRLDTSNPDLRQLLAKVKSEVRQCVLDVRRLVEGLRPPALDDLGLAGVVREHTAALSAAGLEVVVDCPDDLRVSSAAVEVAAYRIATEAMTNVVRHAQASRCQVFIGCRDGRLRLEIVDDGVGLPDTHRDGVGLTSMRERAAELGGVCLAEGSAAGTRVTAEIPLPEDPR